MITAGYCGLACKACSVYIASMQGGEALENRARKAGMTAEELFCKGCRSDKTSPYCTSCEIKKCIREKGYTWCSECEKYPCLRITDFEKSLPHRCEIMKSLDFAKEHSIEKWNEEMRKSFTCEKCGSYNSVYVDTCISCGKEIPTAFAKRYWDIIEPSGERNLV